MLISQPATQIRGKNSIFRLSEHSKVYTYQLEEDLRGRPEKIEENTRRTPSKSTWKLISLKIKDLSPLALVLFIVNLVTINDPFVDNDGNSDDDDDDEDDEEEYIGYRIKFVIFKLDMNTKSWEKIYLLGDRSLFLGNCCTFTVAAADYPGCKPSCIYYTDELSDVEVNGIYDVEKYLDEDIGLGSLVQPFPKLELMDDFLPLLCWIIPYPL
ncbi:hypothetical protein Goklo_005344 [Gossypium klotzschianum]|uniref:KIB1-4 beta-propeller domain-containing protein n=1 Tax=Gossypium klotzschianum TaxID=34286 RepID=A0A7J8VRQ3_9ROSI|nr:hypothetical protein [Gossypium klotzschianum]